MISRSIYNLKIDTIYTRDTPFDRVILKLSNGIRHVMPSTEMKLQLQAKSSMSQSYHSRMCFDRLGEPGRLTGGCVFQRVNLQNISLCSTTFTDVDYTYSLIKILDICTCIFCFGFCLYCYFIVSLMYIYYLFCLY